MFLVIKIYMYNLTINYDTFSIVFFSNYSMIDVNDIFSVIIHIV